MNSQVNVDEAFPCCRNNAASYQLTIHMNSQQDFEMLLNW
uniref:Uncharacterized protein n=1 Tax=Arundo donax TaxID=35708 RepID=A0A0A8Y1D8_ARUDO